MSANAVEPTPCFPADVFMLETNWLRQPFFYLSYKRVNTIDKIESKGRRTIPRSDIALDIQTVRGSGEDSSCR